MSNWDDLKKELTESVKYTIKKLDSLNKEQITEILGEFIKWWTEEKKKDPEERSFYQDKFGGTIAIIRFPKKSFLEMSKSIAKEPKETVNEGSWQWYGIQFPMFKPAERGAPIGTIFINAKAEDINKLWELEESERFFVARGTIKSEYRWINDEKGTYNRSEANFLKEARTKYNNKELTIEQVPKGDLGLIKHTFNISQLLKVI